MAIGITEGVFATHLERCNVLSDCLAADAFVMGLSRLWVWKDNKVVVNEPILRKPV
jgi:hypothetical protein